MKSPTTLIKGGLLAASLMAFAPLAAMADDVSIRLGHVLPESHSWHVAATGFAEEVNNRTEGRVSIKVFESPRIYRRPIASFHATISSTSCCA